VLVCKFQIYKLKNKLQVHVCKYKKLPNFYNTIIIIIIIITYLQFDKLQVPIFKFTSLPLYAKSPNYQITKITKITKLQIASAFLHIYKFAHAKFTRFHTCMYYKMIEFQFAWCASLKLQNCKITNEKWKIAT
jgi:hypothetical protein